MYVKNKKIIFVAMKRTTTILLTALYAVLSAGVVPAHAQREAILHELDHVMDVSESYVDAHRTHIKDIEDMLLVDHLTPKQRYDYYSRLYHEYFSFQFDKAVEMLDKRHDLAVKLGDKTLISDVHIDRATLYATSGMFFEAGDVLENNIDTLHLNHSQMVRYYSAQQRFHSDFSIYTRDHEARTHSERMSVYYRDRLLDITAEDEPLHVQTSVRNLFEAHKWNEAYNLNLSLLDDYANDSHEYAMYAYDQARICEAMGLQEEMIEWFARSAIADIRTATKDNASLCCLAQILIRHNDVDRAFRYVNFSLNDALFYNAKLRPWQISGVMPEIEKAYQAKQQAQSVELRRQEEHSRGLAIVISVLAIVLFAICCYISMLLMRLRRDKHKIEEMNAHIAGANAELKVLNDKLASINLDLREANAVKEEYIALFLSMCSDYIEKLTLLQRTTRRKLSQGKIAELESELSSTKLVDQELNNFYDMFDNAFLNLYPNFVDEFNALLREDAHIEPKRGEKLNTELRIFALIRLGISDSSRIAALLRYSVNTIYNYRARTKNNALGNRDNFEERIKTIGK